MMAGPYAKAGLASGVGGGLQMMGSMLLDAQARQEQRAFREYQIQQDAQDRQERKEERDATVARDDARLTRVAEAAERAEQKRMNEGRARAFQDAQESVTKLQAEGYGASLGPSRLSGDPGVDEYLAGVPSVNAGEYDFGRSPEGRRAKYFVNQGFSPTGARPTPDTSPRLQALQGEGQFYTFDPTAGSYTPATTSGGDPVRPKQAGGAESEFGNLDFGGMGQGAPPTETAGAGQAERSFFGGGGAAGQAPEPMDPLAALNEAYRAGLIQKEEHAQIVKDMKEGRATPEDVAEYLAALRGS